MTPENACSFASKIALPKEDQPSSQEVATLKDCDARKMYYGIGQPVNYVMARKCAYTQLPAKLPAWTLDNVQYTDPVFTGAGILMMIYANGLGVAANADLAMKFACALGGAPAEFKARLEYFIDVRSGGKKREPFDICDDITSRLMTEECTAKMRTVPTQKLRR